MESHSDTKRRIVDVSSSAQVRISKRKRSSTVENVPNIENWLTLFQNPTPSNSPYYEDISDTPLEQLIHAERAEDYFTPLGRQPLQPYQLTPDGKKGSSANNSGVRPSTKKPCPPECLRHTSCQFPPDLMELYRTNAPLRTDCFLSPTDLKSLCPEGYDMWRIMLEKANDKIDGQLFDKHPEIELARRAKTVAWISKSTEKLRLTRETFHLATYYVDRFLSVTSSLSVSDLEQTRVAALYVAMKMDKRFSPKMRDFLTILDQPITLQELGKSREELVKALDFDLLPVTINTWISFYLRLARMDKNSTESSTTLLDGTYSRCLYHVISRVTDFCLLDNESLKFSYRTMAATAFLLCTNPQLALTVSGLSWTELEQCYRWMRPYRDILRENNVCSNGRKHVKPDGSDNLDLHCHFDSWSLYRKLNDLRYYKPLTKVVPDFCKPPSPKLACLVTHPSQLGLERGQPDESNFNPSPSGSDMTQLSR